MPDNLSRPINTEIKAHAPQERPANEGSLRRGLADSWRFVNHPVWVWVALIFNGVFAAIAAVVVATQSSPPLWEIVVAAIVGAIGGSLLVASIGVAVFILRAPYVQRTEARRELRGLKEKVGPDREKVIPSLALDGHELMLGFTNNGPRLQDVTINLVYPSSWTLQLDEGGSAVVASHGAAPWSERLNPGGASRYWWANSVTLQGYGTYHGFRFKVNGATESTQLFIKIGGEAVLGWWVWVAEVSPGEHGVEADASE